VYREEEFIWQVAECSQVLLSFPGLQIWLSSQHTWL